MFHLTCAKNVNAKSANFQSLLQYHWLGQPYTLCEIKKLEKPGLSNTNNGNGKYGIHLRGLLHTTTTTTTTTTILWLCGFCPGQPGWAGTRRNIHPLTLIVVINHPYLLSPSTMIHGILLVQSTYFSLCPQSLSKFSLVYLLAWCPPLHTPYISSPTQWSNTCPYYITSWIWTSSLSLVYYSLVQYATAVDNMVDIIHHMNRSITTTNCPGYHYYYCAIHCLFNVLTYYIDQNNPK